MKELQVRKSIRLKGYDYSRAGYYFLTMCVKDGHEMLGSIDVGTNCVRPRLSEYGEIIKKEISILSNTYDAVYVDKYVIMPNHIHMIIVIGRDNDRRTLENGGRTQFVPTISALGGLTWKLK